LRAVTAIAKQTLRACIRSRVVLVLLALNLIAVFGLPLTVRGDGTATAELQVSLSYSLRAVTVLISLAAMWVGCSGLSGEIESYNMHLVLTKPARRWQVWLGKWLGVFLMSSGVFVISASIIYGLVLFKYSRGDFSESELLQAKSEILVGRRIYSPDVPDFDKIASEEYARRLAKNEFEEGHSARTVIGEIKRQRKAESTGVPPGAQKGWRFEGVRPRADDQPVFVRYRFYVGGKGFDKQRDTVGRWAVINPDADSVEQQVVTTPLMRVRSGGFQEFSFPASLMSEKGQVIIGYENLDPGGSSIVFQPDDGPTLLIRATTFTGNWMRGMLVGVMRLALLSALGCVFGAMFSTPVAIFVAFAYLFLGAILNPELGAPARDFAGNIVSWNLKDMFSYGAMRTVQLFVVSFRSFDVTHALARGYLISGATIARLALVEMLLHGGPVVALGIWVFSRREVGKVIRR